MRLVAGMRRANITSTTPDFAICVLPFVLSLIAGSTDVIGFLGLNGLFTAHITGNLVVLAARVVAGDRTVLSYLLSVPVFMLVLFLTSLFASGLRRFGVSTLRPLLLLQLIFMVAFFMLCVIAGPWRDANATLAIVAGMLGVAAMAAQNALVNAGITPVVGDEWPIDDRANARGFCSATCRSYRVALAFANWPNSFFKK